MQLKHCGRQTRQIANAEDMCKRLKSLLFMIGDGDTNTAAWSKPDKSPRQLKVVRMMRI